MTIRKSLLAAAVMSGTMLALTTSARAEDAYTVDTVHSTVIFRIKHMNTSFSYGRFNDLSGQFSLDDPDSTKNRFDFQVKIESIDTANAKRDQHLKGPDFFNAVQFPTATFKSRSVSKTDGDNYVVDGDFTLHGVTKPVSLKVLKSGAGKDFKQKPIAGFETSFSFKRSDFKMGGMLNAIGDDVFLIVAVEGGK